jgi:hypothetical protein
MRNTIYQDSKRHTRERVPKVEKTNLIKPMSNKEIPVGDEQLPSPKNKEIIVEVEGGVVQHVYNVPQGVSVKVVDHDNEEVYDTTKHAEYHYTGDNPE